MDAQITAQELRSIIQTLDLIGFKLKYVVSEKEQKNLTKFKEKLITLALQIDSQVFYS